MTFNLKYFLKNITLNPIECIKETYFDFKKDYHFKNHINPQKKIWICGLPKSGTTLIEQILDFLPYIRIDRSVSRTFPVKEKLNISNAIQYFNYFPDNKYSYVKTHLEFNKNFVENLKKNNFSTIVSFRDLRDAMISRYYHILSETKHWQHEIVSGENFERGFINSLTKNKSKFKNDPKIPEPLIYYYNWIKDWRIIKDERIKKVWFEDFKTFPEKFIEEILAFTQFKNFGTEKIFKAIKENNIKDKKIKLSVKLQRKNKNVSTFRSGKVGEWKELFTKNIEYEFNKIIPGDLNTVLR